MATLGGLRAFQFLIRESDTHLVDFFLISNFLTGNQTESDFIFTAVSGCGVGAIEISLNYVISSTSYLFLIY